jgi:hypothetical protein
MSIDLIGQHSLSWSDLLTESLCSEPKLSFIDNLLDRHIGFLVRLAKTGRNFNKMERYDNYVKKYTGFVKTLQAYNDDLTKYYFSRKENLFKELLWKGLWET